MSCINGDPDEQSLWPNKAAAASETYNDAEPGA